jgi:decaprenyl-phosphate phosphoribosyltransferase
LAYALAIMHAAAALALSIATVPELVVAICLTIQLGYCHRSQTPSCTWHLHRVLGSPDQSDCRQCGYRHPLSHWFLQVMAFFSLFMGPNRYAELQLTERTGAKICKSLES